MKPGRELDLLVAYNIMGWSIQRKRLAMPIGYVGNTGEVAAYQLMDNPDPFSTDISEIPKIVRVLRDKRVHIKAECGGVCDVWTVTLFHWGKFKDLLHDGSDSFSATSDTLPHAICLAALKAVRVDIED